MNEHLIGTINNTTSLMNKYGIFAKKKFGQNFLISPTIINKVVDSLNEDCTVIEIGTGLGSLTQAMALKVKKVIGFEIDIELYDILKNELSSFTNIELTNIDFLKVDLESLLNTIQGEIVVVSNLPYYITTELLMKILLTGNKKISKIVAMMQKEVGDRFLKTDKGKDYNTLQVIASYYSDITLLTKVGKNNFIPAPKVDSVILQFKLREYKNKVEDDKLLFDVVQACFSQRRKMVLSNLQKSGFSLDKTKLNEIGICETARVEQLSLDDFISLTKVVTK